ncbi:hypothetical protein CL634_09375 [bacterium]|nr:hypothetical protein [bacterium]|tara:strand:+ start:541 stop:1023 length:483 start_codon:yes stop_codon:yes gene_type:complete
MALLEELQKYLIIDKDELDIALTTQADIFYRISEEHSKVLSLRDEAYENVKMIDADLNMAIREDAVADGRKVTEGFVANAVQTSNGHREAMEEYLILKGKADEWSNLKDSFSQRAHALRELVQLYVAGYYATSSVSGASTQATQHEHEQYLAARRKQRKA